MWSKEWGGLWRLALPLMAVQAGNQMRSVVDTVIIGRLSAEALGGVGLANAVFLVVAILGHGTSMGLDPMISQALGGKLQGQARSLLWQGVWMAALMTLPLSVLLVFAAPSLAFLGIEAEVADISRRYLLIRVWELFPVLIFYAVRSYLQALGRTKPLVWSIIVSNVVNLGLTWLLVHGGSDLPSWCGPLRDVPAYGVEGSAVATVFCVLLQLGVVLWGVGAVSMPASSVWSRRLQWPELRKALSLGVPIGLQLSAEVAVFSLMGILAGVMGSVPLAAHKVALTLASVPFTASLGIGNAGAVRVGRALGAGDAPRARVAGWVAIIAGAAWMSCTACFFLLFPEVLTKAMTEVPEVVKLAVPLLALAALFQVSDGLQAVASGVLRGAGDTHFSFVMNLVGHYLVGLPVALLAGFYWGHGVNGLWWGLCAGLTVVAVGLVWRFWRLTRDGLRALEP